MLYHIFVHWAGILPVCNAFTYVSVRALSAMLSALIISFMFGNRFITFSQTCFRARQRDFTPDTHKIKNNTPIMGGLFIILVVLVSSCLWADLTKIDFWLVGLTLLLFGGIGFLDDLAKIKWHTGITPRSKFWLQIIAASIVVGLWLWSMQPDFYIHIPVIKEWKIFIGLGIIPWAVFLLVGTSNAVNLTDGLDGLAIGSLLTNFVVFSIIAYLAGHHIFAQYLHMSFAATSDFAILGASLVGASIGFLWYNAYPAQIFMGDVGSLALGAVLALFALVTRQELLLAVSGGLFVMETVSVIIQRLSYRFLGRRVFKMAPVHHHFELLGWQEPKITVRFNIISLMLALCALLLLKLR